MSWRWREACVLVLLSGVGCEAASMDLPGHADAGADGPVIHSNSGISVPWSQALRSSPHSPVVFAAVVGLSDVEVVRVSGDSVVPATLPRPKVHHGGCSHTVPATLAPLDADQDGLVDLLVHDLCGAYLVLRAETENAVAVEASDWLDGVGPFEFVDVSRASDGSQELSVGSRSSLAFVRSQGVGARWTKQADFAAPSKAVEKPKRGVAPLGNHSWLVVGNEELYQTSWVDDELSYRSLVQPAPQPPNLTKFTHFDDLASVGEQSCGTSLAAIGRFRSRITRSPSVLLQLHVETSRPEMTVAEVSRDLDAYALAAIPLADGQSFLGVLGAEGGHDVFAAYSFRPCQAPTLLASAATTISLRRVAPAYHHVGPASKDHVGLAAVNIGGDPTFFAYDGFEAHVYKVEREGDHWAVRERRTILHRERADIALP